MSGVSENLTNPFQEYSSSFLNIVGLFRFTALEREREEKHQKYPF
jgi:hypothetical protein